VAQICFHAMLFSENAGEDINRMETSNADWLADVARRNSAPLCAQVAQDGGKEM
jgi:hypothetical protein